MRPLAFLCTQAGIALAQCALMHLQDCKYPIKSFRAHPMTLMPQALHTLHQDRIRARDRAAKRAVGASVLEEAHGDPEERLSA